MKAILSKFTSNPAIPHFRINLPLPSSSVEDCMNAVNQYHSKHPPAVFLSINGISENPEDCQMLHDTFKHMAQREKVKVYAFLEDRVTALSYFISTAATHLSANPFCLMGDFSAPHKSYLNLEKLIKYFGIQYERLGTKQKLLWSTYQSPSDAEKQLTAKWLDLIHKNLEKSLAATRKIKPEVINEFGSKLILPQKALELNLIDSIGTMEEFKQKSFPNNKVKTYNFNATRNEPALNNRETDVLYKMAELMTAPKVALMAMEDPLSECLREFVQVFSQRLESPESLAELDALAGIALREVEGRFQSREFLL